MEDVEEREDLGFFQELRQIWALMVWVWSEFISDESKKVARIMLFTQVAAGIVSMVRVWSISIIFDGLALAMVPGVGFGPAFIVAVKGWCLFWFVGKVNTYLNLRGSLKREKLLAVNSGYVDFQVLKKFYAHSLSMHIGEDSNLNEASVRKGNEHLTKIQSILLFQAMEAVLSIVLPLGALIILSFSISSPAVLIAPVLLILMFLGSSLYLARSTVKDAGPIDEEWKAYNRYKVERFREPERVKNNAKDAQEVGEVERQYNEVIRKDLEYWCWYILRSYDRNAISEEYVNWSLALGGLQVLFGKMSLGLLQPVYSWSWRIVDALWRIADIEMQINRSVPSIISLKNALTLPVGIHIPANPIILPKGTPLRIEFKNVSYQYTNKKTKSVVPVLKDISFVIEPGEKVALIGPSGAGKTTVMRLLLRYMDPTSGVILVNGVDLKEIDLATWLDRIGYIRQQSELLSGDIKYNICYGLPDCGESLSDDEVWEIARPLQIDFGESRLSEGLHTRVGFKGIKLSGGQQQRVMIAAAVMKDPDILCSDESTSSLDSSTEKLVQKGLEHYLTERRIAIFNAHRLSTIRQICGKFIVLNGGDSAGSRVVAIAGGFEELAAKCETFRKIAADQDIVL
ncbi:MAG: ABC transporter ATP-binding protein [Candidatus Vogelbacteria bacterium]|nr:ABC transporter ATP-binding protein [Candidatus Vogelbacteria bacterium]